MKIELRPKLPLKLALKHFSFLPCNDLFAHRVNKQFNTYNYVSYKPDFHAKHIDTFTISWSTEDFYCFPPFSCITKVIRKIIQDQARGILVVPDWPTRTWYPLLLPILGQPPYHLPPSADLLIMPSQANLKHPLPVKIDLPIFRVSEKLQIIRFTSNVINIILNSWREETKSQYQSAAKKWLKFCVANNCDMISPP